MPMPRVSSTHFRRSFLRRLSQLKHSASSGTNFSSSQTTVGAVVVICGIIACIAADQHPERRYNFATSVSAESFDVQQQKRKEVASSHQHVASEKHHSHLLTRTGPNSMKSSTKENELISPSPELIECDFVILGNGSAGASAIRLLEKYCPSARIVVLDPFVQAMSPSSPNARNTTYISQVATQLDTSTKTVQLSSSSNTKHIIRYKHSILIATGSRGSPPPPSLIDAAAFSRVLELRSTVLPPHIVVPNDDTTQGELSPSSSTRVSLPPIGVRGLSIMAASQNATVCILGSGLEAVELAAATAASRKASPSPSDNKSGSIKKVMLIFGNAGPLSTKLPRYLTIEVTKRLKQYGIDVFDRFAVRYVSLSLPSNGQTNKDERWQQAAPKLYVHIAKVSDTLDTKRLSADLLVVAPPVDGQRGTAILPSANRSLTESSSPMAWSQFAMNGVLTCYSNDGRIVVNTELNAARDVYAAGSVARYPDHRSGNAVVAGEGYSSANKAGEIAARNMACQYYESERRRGNTQECAKTVSFETSALALWRTDKLPYSVSSHNEGIPLSSSALFSLGVHALCVGDCDSEEMSTHGFWWTSKSSDKRDREQQESSTLNYIEASTTEDDDTGSVDANEGGKEVLLVTRSTVKRRRTSSMTPSRPVYGSGVVFYLGRAGKLCGVMTWGIPFTTSASNSDVNENLLKRIQSLIETNGEIATPSQNNEFLTISDLAEESKRIMSITCSGKTITENVFRQDGTIANPLHRFAPAKPTHVPNLGVLRRKHENGVAVAEDELFIRNTEGTVFQQRPSSLIYVGPMDGNPYYSSSNQFSQDPAMERIYAIQNRRRPPKEDLLWLRQDEANRSSAVHDVMAQLFHRSMRQGKFMDGTDPVEQVQAPVPVIITTAARKLNEWNPFGSEEGATENFSESKEGVRDTGNSTSDD